MTKPQLCSKCKQRVGDKWHRLMITDMYFQPKRDNVMHRDLILCRDCAMTLASIIGELEPTTKPLLEIDYDPLSCKDVQSNPTS